jgi:hypothetical protein
MAVTDHDHVTDLADAARAYSDMVFLQGFEYSSTENVLFIGENVPPLYRFPIDQALARADGLLTVICHPKPRTYSDYWTADMIMTLHPPPIGIEIYNGHYSRPRLLRLDTNPLYTDIWDELLGRGVRLWGFANDDFHDPPDFGRAFNMVYVKERTAGSLMDALKAGRFYATTGLLLKSVSVGSGGIEIELAAAARGRFIGPGGQVLSHEDGTRFSHLPTTEAYVRFEAEGETGRIFLQPFFSRGHP